jgi:nucleoid DNA-binding protein
VPLTQTQLAGAVADRAEITRAEAKRVLDALEDVVLEEIANAEKVKIGGLVQLTVRVKPASKARKGRNPATGEEITIAAKPASVDLRARALTRQRARCRRCRRLDADSADFSRAWAPRRVFDIVRAPAPASPQPSEVSPRPPANVVRLMRLVGRGSASRGLARWESAEDGVGGLHE